MSNKRFQIFVSSTFRDLQEERQAVLESILELRHIPAGMEIFPAADSTPWELIKSIISDSDYYVLIIGGRYGSADSDGISYTEREYELAVELKKPVLAFLHADPDSLQFKKNETQPKARRKLEAFRKRVQQHHFKYWKDISDLRAHVIIALTWAIQTHPAVGWVRADGYNDTELLKRLADLQSRYDVAQQENALLQERLGTPLDTSNLAQGNERVEIEFVFERYRTSEVYAVKYDDKDIYSVELSWDEIFFGIGMDLVAAAREDDLRKALSPVIFGVFSGTPKFIELTRDIGQDVKDRLFARRQSIQTIINQFAALGLIEPHLVSRTVTNPYSKDVGSTLEDAWRLTAKGREKYFRAVARPRTMTSDAQEVR